MTTSIQRRIAAGLLLGVLCASSGEAQSVSPPIAQYRGVKARGSFAVSNNTLYPLTVVLQPRGFVVDEDGELSDVPLDTTRVKLRLSTQSFRLQPRQSYTVFYETAADTTPAWFNIWSGITGAKTESGLNLRIELPHVVYLNQKDKLRQPDVSVHWARYDRSEGVVVMELENTSPRLGRVETITVGAERSKNQEAAGFPLFPGTVRRARIPWTDSIPPAKAEVRFDGFRLTAAVMGDSTAAQ